MSLWYAFAFSLFLADTGLPAPATGPAAPVELVCQPEYYVLLFSYQRDTDYLCPWKAHTFGTFVQVGGPHQIDDVFTISWCTRETVRLFRSGEPGMNRTMEETLARACEQKLRISMWGPYRICPELFGNARKQHELLEFAEETECLLWKALDKKTRFQCERRAINCMHALTDLTGITFETGTNCGDSGTEFVANCYRQCGLVLEQPSDCDWIWEAIRPPGTVVRRRGW